MKHFFFILTICFAISCTNGKKKTETNTLTTASDSSMIFLSLFPEIKADDLHVFTGREYDTLHMDDKFQGKVIDRSFYQYLKFNGLKDPMTTDTFYHYYACYKFSLTNNKTGLIIRTPSQYNETAIDLYTWDNVLKKVIDITNLTDAFGDEGWYFVQDAWLKDLNGDSYLDIITRRRDFDQDLDDSTKIFRSDSLFVLLGNGKTFKKVSYNVDTNKFQLNHWVEKRIVF